VIGVRLRRSRRWSRPVGWGNGPTWHPRCTRAVPCHPKQSAVPRSCGPSSGGPRRRLACVASDSKTLIRPLSRRRRTARRLTSGPRSGWSVRRTTVCSEKPERVRGVYACARSAFSAPFLRRDGVARHQTGAVRRSAERMTSLPEESPHCQGSLASIVRLGVGGSIGVVTGCALRSRTAQLGAVAAGAQANRAVSARTATLETVRNRPLSRAAPARAAA